MSNLPASSAGEAIERMLVEKKISTKINYEVLRGLDRSFAGPGSTSAPFQSDTGLLGSDGGPLGSSTEPLGNDGGPLKSNGRPLENDSGPFGSSSRPLGNDGGPLRWSSERLGSSPMVEGDEGEIDSFSSFGVPPSAPTGLVSSDSTLTISRTPSTSSGGRLSSLQTRKRRLPSLAGGSVPVHVPPPK